MSGLPRTDIPVCFVSSHAQLGGAELYLDSLLHSLGPAWVQGVVVLTEGPFVGRVRARGIPTAVVPAGGRRTLPVAAMRLRRLLRSRRPAVVHANGVKAALVSVLATAGTGIPVLWHKHDSAHDGRIAIAIARRCRLVVGVSHAAVAALDGVVGVRTAVVRNGIPPYEVDREAARAALLRELGAPSSSRLVIQVGRLHPGKGQVELVEIAAQLRDRVPELRLVFVGQADPYEPAYADMLDRAVAEHALGDRVVLLGHREDAVAVTAGCDVLAMPSRPDPVSGWREGLPLTPLESMAVGTPVAAYAEPGIVEAVGTCAALVPTGDRDGLAAAIAGLVEDPGASAGLSECGRRRVAEYGLAEAAEGMKARYREVAA